MKEKKEKKSIKYATAFIAVILSVLFFSKAEAATYGTYFPDPPVSTTVISSTFSFGLDTVSTSSPTSTANYLTLWINSVSADCDPDWSMQQEALGGFPYKFWKVASSGLNVYYSPNTLWNGSYIPAGFSGLIAFQLPSMSFQTSYSYAFKANVEQGTMAASCAVSSTLISFKADGASQGNTLWSIYSNSLNEAFTSSEGYIDFVFPQDQTSTSDFLNWTVQLANLSVTSSTRNLKVFYATSSAGVSTSTAYLNSAITSNSNTGTFQVSFPKTLALSNGVWYAKAQVLNNNTVIDESLIISFTVTGSNVIFGAGGNTIQNYNASSSICGSPPNILAVGEGIGWAFCHLTYPHNFSTEFFNNAISNIKETPLLGLPFQVYDALQAGANVLTTSSYNNLTIVLPGNIYDSLSTTSRTFVVFNGAEMDTIWDIVPGSKADVFLIEDYFMAVLTVLFIFWQIRHPFHPFSTDQSVERDIEYYKDPKTGKIQVVTDRMSRNASLRRGGDIYKDIQK